MTTTAEIKDRIAYRKENLRDDIAHFAARRLPRRVRYWSLIHDTAHHTCVHDQTASPTSVTAMEVAKTLHEDMGLHHGLHRGAQ